MRVSFALTRAMLLALTRAMSLALTRAMSLALTRASGSLDAPLPIHLRSSAAVMFSTIVSGVNETNPAIMDVHWDCQHEEIKQRAHLLWQDLSGVFFLQSKTRMTRKQKEVSRAP